MEKTIVILFALGIVLCILYLNGCLVISAKRAVMFVGSQKGNKATFSLCDGYIKRIIKFKQNKTYHFTFDLELTQGEVSVELVDSQKQKVMILKSDNRSEDVLVDKNQRYSLFFHFKSATGSYVLNWN